MQKLEQESNITLKWFEDNNMKMNSGKYHLFISRNKHEHMLSKIDDDKIWESRTVKLLGITIANELKFNEYISNVCKKSPKETYCTSNNKRIPRFQ